VRLHSAEVSVAGKVLVPPEQRAIAVAFQDATLFPHLDAVGNAAFAIKAADKAARLHRAREALRDMGLEAMDGRDVATLSGGEAQRVSLARALAAEARLLLLDEPFGNVDRLTRADLLRRLKGRLAGGPGALIITHDPADAIELGARVLLMREGRLIADGPYDALAAGERGEFARDFLRAG
jgi:iron(III) transport system ATP-binding protein